MDKFVCKSKRYYMEKNESSLFTESIWDVFDAFVKESGTLNGWTPATYAKFRTVRMHLKEYDECLSFQKLDVNGMNDYVRFLYERKSMRNNTVLKQIGFVRWFLRWSAANGYYSDALCRVFRPKLKIVRKKVIFLTKNELEKIKALSIPNSKRYLERVRDVFLFCCYTGLRYSDVRNLKKSDIGVDAIEITTVKTSERLIVELNGHSRTILKKYVGVKLEGERALPVISNQKMNLYLKELGRLSGIDDPVREVWYRGGERFERTLPKYALLGTHAGRRTFICTAISLGIPVPVVMQWTGHSDYKAMKPYEDVAGSERMDCMRRFDAL